MGTSCIVGFINTGSMVPWLATLSETLMNPIAAIIIVLGVLLIIVGVKGSYKNVGQEFKKL